MEHKPFFLKKLFSVFESSETTSQPQEEQDEEYKKIHEEYKKLVIEKQFYF